jgi:dihydroorotase
LGSSKFFLGTDSAPHAKGAKEHACGCAGCYTALHAMELYAQAFDAAGALDKLEGFASFHGADFYGMPRNQGHITLQRESWELPAELPMGDATVVPLDGGSTLGWKMV